jgi:uncharacterized protein YbjT (DUF2867 family)
MAQVLVAGASGRLRPVVSELLSAGHRVRVTARNPGGAGARELSSRGAEIAQADLDDRASLTAAMAGMDAVFGAGSPHQAGPEGETRHGINLAEAAADAGVGHLVFSSGDGADRPTGVPVLESKRAVEVRIRELGLPHTILAPVYFMENAFNPWNLGALAAQRFPLPLPPERPLQQLAIEALAAVAALVIERGPDGDRRIALAGDELTGEEAAAGVARATRRPFTFEHVPLETLPPGMRLLFGWLDREGHAVDISAVRNEFPGVRWQSFEDWASAQPWPVGERANSDVL